MNSLLQPYLTRFFAETETTRAIRSAIEYAVLTVESPYHSEPSPSLIIGKPGTGKTTALLKAASEDSRTIYIQASEGLRNINGLLKTLLAAMRVWHGRRHAADLHDLAMVHLDNSNSEYENRCRTIILVDEYQIYDLRAVRELMRMCEAARVPLVLSGNNEKLKTTKAEKTAIDQILSRIGKVVEVASPTSKDCHSIAVSYNVEGKEAYALLAEYGKQHSLRELGSGLN